MKVSLRAAKRRFSGQAPTLAVDPYGDASAPGRGSGGGRETGSGNPEARDPGSTSPEWVDENGGWPAGNDEDLIVGLVSAQDHYPLRLLVENGAAYRGYPVQVA